MRFAMGFSVSFSGPMDCGHRQNRTEMADVRAIDMLDQVTRGFLPDHQMAITRPDHRAMSHPTVPR